MSLALSFYFLLFGLDIAKDGAKLMEGRVDTKLDEVIPRQPIRAYILVRLVS